MPPPIGVSAAKLGVASAAVAAAPNDTAGAPANTADAPCGTSPGLRQSRRRSCAGCSNGGNAPPCRRAAARRSRPSSRGAAAASAAACSRTARSRIIGPPSRGLRRAPGPGPAGGIAPLAAGATRASPARGRKGRWLARRRSVVRRGRRARPSAGPAAAACQPGCGAGAGEQRHGQAEGGVACPFRADRHAPDRAALQRTPASRRTPGSTSARPDAGQQAEHDGCERPGRPWRDRAGRGAWPRAPPPARARRQPHAVAARQASIRPVPASAAATMARVVPSRRASRAQQRLQVEPGRREPEGRRQRRHRCQREQRRGPGPGSTGRRQGGRLGRAARTCAAAGRPTGRWRAPAARHAETASEASGGRSAARASSATPSEAAASPVVASAAPDAAGSSADAARRASSAAASRPGQQQEGAPPTRRHDAGQVEQQPRQQVDRHDARRAGPAASPPPRWPPQWRVEAAGRAWRGPAARCAWRRSAASASRHARRRTARRRPQARAAPPAPGRGARGRPSRQRCARACNPEEQHGPNRVGGEQSQHQRSHRDRTRRRAGPSSSSGTSRTLDNPSIAKSRPSSAALRERSERQQRRSQADEAHHRLERRHAERGNPADGAERQQCEAGRQQDEQRGQCGYSMSSGCLRRGGGKRGVQRRPGPPASGAMLGRGRVLRAHASGSAAFGIADHAGLRSVQAIATCAGRRRRAARRPPQRRVAQQPPALARPANTPSPACRARGTRAAGRTRCRGRRDCRAPGWWRSPAAPSSISSTSKLRHAPVRGSCPASRSALERLRPSRRSACCPASAADRGRCSRSAAASGCARRPSARRCGWHCADRPC